MGDLVTIKLSGLEGVLATLQSLPREVVSKRGGPVLAALKKGAKVIAQQEKANLRSIIAHDAATAQQESTGLLMKSIVVSRGKAPTGGNGERVLVRIKRKTYPRVGKGKGVTTLQSAQILEYGSSRQPARPWIRSAFSARAIEAIATVERELLKGIDRIVKKLSAQNKGR